MMTRGNENENEDLRDTEPILSRETVSYSDNRDNFTSEDELLLGDISLVHTGLKITGSSDEDNESINVDQPQCRIFLDTGGEYLIAPCCCRGTQKLCIDHVLTTGGWPRRDFLFPTVLNAGKCSICVQMYHLIDGGQG